MSDDYKIKRMRNNESVKKCRKNERNRIQATKQKLEHYVNENKSLEEKYSNLQKELQVLKSLFDSSATSENSGKTSNEIASDLNKISNSKIKNSNSEQNAESTESLLAKLISKK